MNWYAVKAIYLYEMARTWRTIGQSVVSPVLSTSLYFVVFGAAIGSRIDAIDGISYGAFIVPGLIMLTLLTQAISNASFGIYFPRFVGTIYEVLSAPISHVEIVLGYVGAAASKAIMLGVIIIITARFFVSFEIAHPLAMVFFLTLTAVAFAMLGFIIGIWADSFEKLQIVPLLVIQPLTFLFDIDAAAGLAEDHAGQSRRLPDQRLPLELLREWRRGRRRQHTDDWRVLEYLPRYHCLDIQNRI